jgi:hypothetical protein
VSHCRTRADRRRASSIRRSHRIEAHLFGG